jgi:hypothetical protein|tara:strand:+ start:512 stop:787 length:276 start_codon:yes stop_codon:yes gene_type:complete
MKPMKDNVLEFTGEYYTTMKRSKELNEELSVLLITELQKKGINTDDPQCILDLAWVVKFIQVTLDNQLGIANDLGRLMRNITKQDNEAHLN